VLVDALFIYTLFQTLGPQMRVPLLPLLTAMQVMLHDFTVKGVILWDLVAMLHVQVNHPQLVCHSHRLSPNIHPQYLDFLSHR